jgi:hypothetical protein
VSTALNKKIRWEALEVLESDSDHRFSRPDLNRYILRFDDPVDKGISRQVLFPTKKENLKEAWSHFSTAMQLLRVSVFFLRSNSRLILIPIAVESWM